MKSRMVGLVVVLALGAGTGVALGQGSSDGPGDTPSGSYQTVADCPAEAATVAKLTGQSYEFFAPRCPTSSEVDEVVSESKPRPDMVAACRDTLRKDSGNEGCQAVVDFAAQYEDSFGSETGR